MALATKILLGALAVVLLLITGQFLLQSQTDPTSLSGFSKNTAPLTITMSDATLAIPENLIRFHEQRKSGPKPRIDLAVEWPGLEGYSDKNATLFHHESTVKQLIFITLEEGANLSAPERKLEEIYRRFFIASPWRGPNGLIGQALDPTSGYQHEDVLYARHNGSLFITRCLQADAVLPDKVLPTCLYEFPLDTGLNVYVRFHRDLLVDWQNIDKRLKRLLTTLRSN